MIREIKLENNVKEKLQEVLDNSENLDGVMIIFMNKDGTQGLRGSSMNLMEKSLLLSFHHAAHIREFPIVEQ